MVWETVRRFNYYPVVFVLMTELDYVLGKTLKEGYQSYMYSGLRNPPTVCLAVCTTHNYTFLHRQQPVPLVVSRTYNQTFITDKLELKGHKELVDVAYFCYFC